MRGLWKAFFLGLRRTLKLGEYILGVDENTALVGKLGDTWQVLGKGQAHLIWGDRQQDYTVGQQVFLPGQL